VDDIIGMTLHLAMVCKRLGVPYMVGGSLASSLHGIPRATQDVDLVLAIQQEDVAGLVAALRADFYLDEEAIRDAIERRTSFNLIHLGSFFKADIFVAKDDEVSRLQMARTQRYRLGEGADRELVVASPEDIVAQKLSWFALGDQASERQWNDALGVLKVAGLRLDLAYLERVSVLLGVEELLERALIEAAVTPRSGGA
jgi:hypothetical protein